jgi:LuxR family transcriptional regulator
MTKVSDNNTRFFIESSQRTAEIASVLQQLKIYHFTFLERFNNGEVIYFSNNANWVRDYFDKELYRTSQFDTATPEFQNFDYVIWPEDSTLDVYKYARDHYDSHHGITLVRKLPNSVRYFFFSTTQDLAIVKQIYVNNLEALERFASFFEQEAKQEIQAASKFFKTPEKKVQKQHGTKVDKGLLNRFYEETKLDFPNEIFMPAFGLVKISPQEWRCFAYLSKHYTTPEIAEKLGLSVRTIETHLNNLKNKLGCFRKTELFELALRFKYMFN